MTTHDALLEYLRAKAPDRIGVATLPFEGKNQVVYLLPRARNEHAGLQEAPAAGCQPCEES